MIILPPRRDSEKDTLANYRTGAAVEKKISVSIFMFFLCFTHTLPLTGICAGFPAELSLVLKIRSLSSVFLSVQSTVGFDFDLPN